MNTPVHPKQKVSGATPDNLRQWIHKEIDSCWARHSYFVAEQSRVISWVGTTFIGLIVLTGLFDDRIRTEDGMWPVWFLVLVHAIYLIAWMFYLHNKLQAATSQYMAVGWENMYQQHFAEGNKFPVTGIRERASANHLWGARAFSKVAVTLTVIAYFGTAFFAPGAPLQFTERGFEFDWRAVITMGVFLVAVGISWVAYHYELKRRLASIDKDMQQLLGQNAISVGDLDAHTDDDAAH